MVALYIVALVMDILACNKKWNRAVSMAAYVLFFLCYLYTYTNLCNTLKKSAFMAFEQHKANFNGCFITVIIVLTLREFLYGFSFLGGYDSIKAIKWTNFWLQALTLFPIFAYCYANKASEDCLTCFSRHPHIHFSRY